MDTLGSKIYGSYNIQVYLFSEVQIVLTTPVGTKIFVFIMEVFSIMSLIRRVCEERFHCMLLITLLVRFSIDSLSS